MTPHRVTIFTTCLFNTRPNYSHRIFSQCRPHTVAPSQIQASGGTAGFTQCRAAKEDTPYPPALSCAPPQPPHSSSSLPTAVHPSHLPPPPPLPQPLLPRPVGLISTHFLLPPVSFLQSQEQPPALPPREVWLNLGWMLR